MTFTFKYRRKLLIYIMTIFLMVVCSMVMDEKKYEPFLKYSTFLAVAFFAGNSLEHLAGAVKEKRAGPAAGDPPGGLPT